MFIDYVSVIISYIYHYRSMSRLTLSYDIRYVINPLNLAFPPAEVCAADVEFFLPKWKGGVCARGPPHPHSYRSTASAAQIYSRLLRPWPTSAVESAQLTTASIGR